MNILQLEDQVKGLADDRLIQEAKTPSGQIPQYLLVSEVQRRADMRKRYEAEKPQNEGTVADQILNGGIGSIQRPPEGQGMPQPNMPQHLPQGPGIAQPPGQFPPVQNPNMGLVPPGTGLPQMPPQGMAGGGIVRMEHGGRVYGDMRDWLSTLAGDSAARQRELYYRNSQDPGQVDPAQTGAPVEDPAPAPASDNMFVRGAAWMQNTTGGDLVDMASDKINRGIAALKAWADDPEAKAKQAEIRQRAGSGAYAPREPSGSLDNVFSNAKDYYFGDSETLPAVSAADVPAPTPAPATGGLAAILAEKSSQPALEEIETRSDREAARKESYGPWGLDDEYEQLAELSKPPHGGAEKQGFGIERQSVSPNRNTEYDQMLKQQREAAWANALIQLGAGIAGGDLSKGLSAAGTSMAEGQRDVGLMQREKLRQDAYAAMNENAASQRAAEFKAQMSQRERFHEDEMDTGRYGTAEMQSDNYILSLSPEKRAILMEFKGKTTENSFVREYVKAVTTEARKLDPEASFTEGDIALIEQEARRIYGGKPVSGVALGTKENPIDATTLTKRPPSGTWIRKPDGTVVPVP